MHHVLLLGLMVATSQASDAPKKEEAKPSPAALKLENLQTELKKAAQTLVQEYGQADSEEAKDKIKNRYFELLSQTATKLQGMASDHAKDPVGQEARQFTVQILQVLARSGSATVGQQLRLMLAKAADNEQRGQASFALARNLIKQYEQAYQKKDKDAAKLIEEAESLLKEAAAKYGDIPFARNKLSDHVPDVLFELKHLTVGKTAMEIEGEDTDGKPFKLSDYRGKVVVLDFWGHW